MKQHPHIDIITAWYNGETIEYRRAASERWKTLDRYRLQDIPPAFDPKYHYRIKPKTFTLVLNEDQIHTLKKSMHYYRRAEGDDNSIDGLYAKVNEAEKNA